MRRQSKKFALDNFREHVRAVAELSGKMLIADTTGVHDLVQTIQSCEEKYKLLVHAEALYCLGLAAGRSARRRIAAKGQKR